MRVPVDAECIVTYIYNEENVMSDSKIFAGRTGKQKAKAAAVSSPAEKVRKVRAARIDANAKLEKVTPAPIDAAVVAKLTGLDVSNDYKAPPVTNGESFNRIDRELAKERADLDAAAAAKQIPPLKFVRLIDPTKPTKVYSNGKPVTPQVPPPKQEKPVMTIVPRATQEKPVTIEQQPKPPEPVILAEPQTLRLDLKFLHACITVAPTKDVRTYLNGVHIHQLPDGQTRVVATDGHRLLAVVVPNEQTLEWAAGGGVTLPTSELQRIARYFGKQGEVDIAFGIGHPTATISQPGDMAKFSLTLLTDDRWPDYQRVMDAGAAAFSSERVSMETANINTDYLKSAGHIANQLDAKGVMPFVGGDPKCWVVFTFAEVPEALLYIMPMGQPDECVSDTATRMLGKASMTETVALLREQAKLKTARAKVAKHKFFRDQFTAASLKLNQRADALESKLMLQITGPKAVKV